MKWWVKYHGTWSEESICGAGVFLHHSFSSTTDRPLLSSRIQTMMIQASIKQSCRRSFFINKTTSPISFSSSSSFRPLQLHPPTIIYSDNHLLVVNKPPGWHSVPNTPKHGKSNGSCGEGETKKCLLTYLKTNKLGGGSKSDFLIPLHGFNSLPSSRF